jgi:NAD(P)-dependent dehydrogenase (short-subunit alcohol dehydrogenase family)
VLTLARGKPSRLILAGRSKSKIEPLIQEINGKYPEVRADFVTLDLGSLESVRKAATDVQALGAKLDVLILNAAVMAIPFQKTVDGFEGQFGTNHLGHFLLLSLLPRPSTPESRIVIVASSAHALAETNFDGKNYAYTVRMFSQPRIRLLNVSSQDAASYNATKAYAQSKSANILFAMSLAEKHCAGGTSAFSLNPGSIKTNLQTYMHGDTLDEAMQLAAAGKLSPLPLNQYHS